MASLPPSFEPYEPEVNEALPPSFEPYEPATTTQAPAPPLPILTPAGSIAGRTNQNDRIVQKAVLPPPEEPVPEPKPAKATVKPAEMKPIQEPVTDEPQQYDMQAEIRRRMNVLLEAPTSPEGLDILKGLRRTKDAPPPTVEEAIELLRRRHAAVSESRMTESQAFADATEAEVPLTVLRPAYLTAKGGLSGLTMGVGGSVLSSFEDKLGGRVEAESILEMLPGIAAETAGGLATGRKIGGAIGAKHGPMFTRMATTLIMSIPRNIGAIATGDVSVEEAMGNVGQAAGAAAVGLGAEMGLPQRGINAITQVVADAVYDIGVAAARGQIGTDMSADEFTRWFLLNELPSLVVSASFAYADARDPNFRLKQQAMRSDLKRAVDASIARWKVRVKPQEKEVRTPDIAKAPRGVAADETGIAGKTEAPSVEEQRIQQQASDIVRQSMDTPRKVDALPPGAVEMDPNVLVQAGQVAAHREAGGDVLEFGGKLYATPPAGRVREIDMTAREQAIRETEAAAEEMAPRMKPAPTVRPEETVQTEPVKPPAAPPVRTTDPVVEAELAQRAQEIDALVKEREATHITATEPPIVKMVAEPEPSQTPTQPRSPTEPQAPKQDATMPAKRLAEMDANQLRVHGAAIGLTPRQIANAGASDKALRKAIMVQQEILATGIDPFEHLDSISIRSMKAKELEELAQSLGITPEKARTTFLHGFGKRDKTQVSDAPRGKEALARLIEAELEQRAIEGRYTRSDQQAAINKAIGITKPLTQADREEKVAEIAVGIERGTEAEKADARNRMADDLRKYASRNLDPKRQAYLNAGIDALRQAKSVKQAERIYDAVLGKLLVSKDQMDKRKQIDTYSKLVTTLNKMNLPPEVDAELRKIEASFDPKKMTDKTKAELYRRQQTLFALATYLGADLDTSIVGKDYIESVNRLYQKPLNEMTGPEIEALNRHLTMMVAAAKTAKENREGANAQWKEEQVNDILGATAKHKAKYAADDDSVSSFKKAGKQNIFKRGYRFLRTLESVLLALDHGEKNGPFRRLVYGNGEAGHNNQKRIEHNFMRMFEEGIRPLGITYSESKYLAGDWSGLKPKSIEVPLPDAGTIKATSMERVLLAATMLDAGGRRALKSEGFRFDKAGKGTKLTERDILAFLSTLDAKELAVLKFMPTFFKYGKTEMNATSQKIDGYNVIPEGEGFYITLRRLQDDFSGKTMPGTSKSKNVSVESQSIAKERIGGGEPLIIGDALTVMMKYANQASKYAAWSEPLRNMRTVLGDKRVLQAMRETFGSDTPEYLDRMIQKMEGEQQPSGKLDKALNWLVARRATQVLGFKPQQFITQGVGWIGLFDTDLPVQDLITASKKPMTQLDWNSVRKYSPVLWDRVVSQGNLEAGEVSRGRLVRKALTGSPSVTEMSLYATKYGDLFVVGRAWKAAEDAVSRLYPDLEGEAKGQAVARMAEMAVHRSQSSYGVKDRSELFAQQGGVAKTLTFMGSQVSKQASQLDMAITRLRYNPSPETAFGVVRSVLTIGIQAFLTAMISTGSAWLYGRRKHISREDDPDSLDWNEVKRRAASNLGSVLTGGMGMGEDAARIAIRVAEKGWEGLDRNILESMNPDIVFYHYAQTLTKLVLDHKAQQKLKDYDENEAKKENRKRLRKDWSELLGAVSGINLGEATRLLDAYDFYKENQ